MDSVDSLYFTESWENIKDPVVKYYMQWGWNPGPLLFQSSMLLSELSPHALVSLRHLDSHIFMLYWFLDLDDSVRINRTCLHKDLRLKSKGEISSDRSMLSWNGRSPGFQPHWGLYFTTRLFFVFLWFCRIYRIYI